MKETVTKIGDCFAVHLPKFVSKKFVVWAAATVALFTDYISADQWTMFSMMYAGIQGVLDFRGGQAPPPKQ